MDETAIAGRPPASGNGQPAGRVYVKFGPKDTQEVQLATAEHMLADLYQAQPALFGRLLQAAMGIEGTRRR